MVAYEERVVCFLDVLGWADLLKDSPKNDVLQQSIDSVAEFVAELSGFTREIDNVFADLYDEVPEFKEMALSAPGLRASHFSDTLVISCPPKPECVVPLVASAIGLILVLVRGGYYVRGALTRGQLRHTEKSLFGPAIVRAHHIEQRIAIYPRVVVTEDTEPLVRELGWTRTDRGDGLRYLDYLERANAQDLATIRTVFEARTSDDIADPVRMQKHGWFRLYLDDVERIRAASSAVAV